MKSVTRCAWCSDDPLYQAYHDKEWGIPVYDQARLFEFLILEGMQAGLSWLTILKKRDAMRQAFAQFNPEALARYDNRDIKRLLENPGIIRHPGKIASAINNAQAWLNLQENNDPVNYLWQFTEGKPQLNHWQQHQDIPSLTPASTAMAKALKQKTFSFVGPTICYAFMQAVGMVNDHTLDCFLRAGK